MALNLENDLDYFFVDFCETATHDAETFTVIFEKNFAIAVNGVETSAPAATAKTSDVESLELVHGDTITVDGTDYIINGIQDDGTGLTVLILREDE